MLDKLKKILATKEYKACSKCGKAKPLSEFSKSKNSKDGLQWYCKECNKKYQDVGKSAYIYLIYQDKEIVYIGSTNNIKKRICNHLNYNTNLRNYIKKNTWSEIRYIEFEGISRQELYYIEGVFIEEMIPSLNQVKVSCSISSDRLQEVSELAYETLEHFQEVSEQYKKNYSKVA